MKLPFRRRRRSGPAQVLHVVLTVLGIRARLKLVRAAGRTALRGVRVGRTGVRVARAVPWRPLGVAVPAVAVAVVALVVQRVRSRRNRGPGAAAPAPVAGSGPGVTAPAPAVPATPPGGVTAVAPATPAGERPTEPALDLDGPNESAPGHHPTDEERQAAS
jgi:hypothetical protein